MTNIFFRLTATLAFLFCMNGLAHAQQLVRIQVYGTHEGSNIVYHYRVINDNSYNSNISLTNIVIGSIFKSGWDSEGGQLERLPLGANFINTDSESGGDIQLAPTSTTQPPYWTAEMYGPGIYSLEWHLLPDGHPYAIPPGQSLGGFSVTLPLFDIKEGPHEYYNAGLIVDPTTSDIDPRDDIYLRASFKASYIDNKTYALQEMRGQLEIADKTPPTLSVTLTPATIWPPDNKMVTVNATINVHDDYDPNPVVHIVSITANEPLGKDDIQVGKLFTDIRQFQLKAAREGSNKAGRIYTVTYVALDASGNQTTATATVTVPHDQGKK